jgi:PTH1 family peptidyl-tRNA hydrolase
MKLVVGLGNPGRRYEATRHNVGFRVAAAVAAQTSISAARSRFEGDFQEARVDDHRFAVLCPATFMNASGRSVRQAVDFYRLEPAQVLVVCDDFALPVAKLRIRAKGSAGGQKGLADILRVLGTEAVPRCRVGIGTPPGVMDPADYVLGKFTREELPAIELAVERAAEAALNWVRFGLDYCMARYNAGNGTPPAGRSAEG